MKTAGTQLLTYRADSGGDPGEAAADRYVVEYALSTIGGRTDTANPGPTLFLHGLAGSIDDARPLASGIQGTRVFAHLPGHGRSTGPEPLSYDVLARAARAVADHTDVRCALGISLGAATLLRILTETPDRFDRVVLYLPAVADLPRSEEAIAPHRLLAASLRSRDEAGITEALLRTQPLAVRGTRLARDWAEQRAAELLAEAAASVERADRADRAGRVESASRANPDRWLPLASEVPLTSLDVLRAVTVPVLVIAQEGDPAHPVAVARRLAEALPDARLEVFDEQGALWGHRRILRTVVAPFIADVRSVTMPS